MAPQAVAQLPVGQERYPELAAALGQRRSPRGAQLGTALPPQAAGQGVRAGRRPDSHGHLRHRQGARALPRLTRLSQNGNGTQLLALALEPYGWCFAGGAL